MYKSTLSLSIPSLPTNPVRVTLSAGNSSGNSLTVSDPNKIDWSTVRDSDPSVRPFSIYPFNNDFPTGKWIHVFIVQDFPVQESGYTFFFLFQ